MADIDLKTLVSKLNSQCRQSLESALGLCLARTHYNVEIEHWLQKLVETQQLDIQAIAKHHDVSIEKLLGQLQDSMYRFKTGNSRAPALSPSLVQWMREAWLLASLQFGESRIRSGHLLLALLLDETLRRQAIGSCPELSNVSPQAVLKDFALLTDGGPEAQEAVLEGESSSSSRNATSGSSKTPSLDQFTIDLTQRAREGKIDPVLGRDDEIRQVIDILCRRRQNNPILTGEPGVGKTAVAEGFALRIVEENVPQSLLKVSLRVLDLALLQAGAGVKGEFENRLKSVIEEVKSSSQPIILFIDEAHSLIGAGGQAGQGDAANLLKPALARGDLRTIAATTWAEYKKYFEKDAALARRFQVIEVVEPCEKTAIAMLRGLVGTLEAHHGVRILTEAVEDAVKLSRRYISSRQLPDKAISLLDTTCARISLSQSTKPPAVEDCQRQMEQAESAIAMLKREAIIDPRQRTRISELESVVQQASQRLLALTSRWEQELELVRLINEKRRHLLDVLAPVNSPATTDQQSIAPTLGSASDNKTATAESVAEIERLESQLRTLQGDSPLVHACCDSNAIASTVASWTGIPVGRMMSDEIRTVLNLKQLMEKSIVGQNHALDQIAESVRTSRAKLTDPNRPVGVFLLAGTSGVGKTETALRLAELLYGGEQNLTIINMSEFQEQHKVSLLMGSPPGYVGYGEGGVLTEAVRRKPYSVILLDELEKAHEGVQEVFYQVFDKGHMKDSEGRDIDFKNTLIIMTSNAGTELIKNLCADPDTAPDASKLRDALYPELLKTFKPAFLGRVSIIPYFPLPQDVMRRIIYLKLGKVQQRIEENYQAKLIYSDSVIDAILERCVEADTGARNVDKILNRTLLPELSAEFLSKMASGESIGEVEIQYVGDRFTYQLH